MKKRNLNPLVLLTLVLVMSCNKDEIAVKNIAVEQKPNLRMMTEAKSWTNILIDNFDPGSNLDANWQRTERLDYNSNLCMYRPWNASIANLDNKSCLRLRSYKKDNRWESAHVKSRVNFKPNYNEQVHVQVSAKVVAVENSTFKGFAETYGVWPAIWTVQENAWPVQGEIDIMEAYSYGYYGGEKYASNLFYGYNAGQSLLDQNAVRHYDYIGEGWHTYDMYWSNVNGSVYVDILVDGNQVANYHNGIDPDLRLENFGPHNVILNLNIGSNTGIFNNNAINVFWNTDMYVDYVRVQKTSI
ncbi:glycoside hydrolase family 16 protein [Fulvivirga sediminis]|uniref:Family 16 glycosylhydrolase n=1 Tax=Fulvivirga sediminis TaxID=2803949 RepID=A0A937F7P8_9BACT|nr:family 16 glycosylhydrolase [Fulvivirga sediminis]MBL3655845.1 family 16 glycosylhydrolase [Fulvivirga sediminis]